MYSHTELTDFSLLIQGILSFCFFISSFFVAANDYAGSFAVFSALLFVIFTGVSHYGISYSPSKTFYGAILGASVVLVFISFQNAILWGQYSSCTTSPSMNPSVVPTSSPTLFPTSAPTDSAAAPTYAPSISSSTMTPTFSPTSYSFRATFSPTNFITSPLATILSSSVVFFKSSTSSQLFGQLLQHRELYGVECVNSGAMKALCVFSVLLMLSYIFFTTILIRFKDDILGNMGNNGLYSAVMRSEDNL